MKVVVVWVGVLYCCVIGGCLISPVMQFGEGKSARESQHDLVTAHVAPNSFERAHDWDGKISTARIRVWADDSYRAQNIHWQQTFEDELEHANDVLSGLFGVRLVAELRSWSRAAPEATLEDSMRELAELDPGDDVLTVVGLTSSLRLVAATFEQLGFAEVGGRHMVLRGYADLEERKLFEQLFTELSAEERELLYHSRRRHKTTGILLHELGHNLGAEHVEHVDTLMHAMYSDHASKFDPHSREVILASVDRRLRRGPSASADAAPPAAPGAAAATAAKPTTRLVIDLDSAGEVSTKDKPLDGAQLDALFVDAGSSTEVTVRYTKGTPLDTVSAIVGRAQAAGCRVVIARY
jgi:hypothetical protein